jgi:5-methylcytosine-specific restriction endonuclease McrA
VTNHRRRARQRLRATERYAALEIAERDSWVCQICGRRIGRSYSWPHPRSLSIDHIVPQSEGGDDVKANVQAAHLGCNIRKGTRGVDQLRLIG